MISRRRRTIFALAAVVLTLVVPFSILLATDVYLHRRYERSAGLNVWGYRGPAVGRKRPGEYRVVVLGGSAAYGYGVHWDQAMPAVLERQLNQRRSGSSTFTVLNLAYNNEAAYSFKFTLRDYEKLDYDLACLYEGYNDRMGDTRPNLSVFRHDSPVFRLTGYMPMFPMVFKEKAAAMLNGGDTSAAYRSTDQPVFRAPVAARATADVLTATADVAEALERQLGRVTAEAPRRIADGEPTGCKPPWNSYCRSISEAVSYALQRHKQVLVVTQPYEFGDASRARHMEQQREMAAMLERRFGGNATVKYVNLGERVELGDPAWSFDRMHLTPMGNERLVEGLVGPVLDLAARRSGGTHSGGIP
jgi:hypothetical protein